MSDPNTIEALIERWREPSGDLAVKLCADELAALAPHYIHKDKVRELRDEYKAAVDPDHYKYGNRIFEQIAMRLTALLGKEGE